MRISPVRTVAVAAAVAAVSLALVPQQAQAAGSVHLMTIWYDSPGSDTRSNTSLNAEWVRIGNSTSRGVSLRGWTLTDASRHVYTFGAFTLQSGKTVMVRTGRGTNTTANLYQQRAAYVWNNDRDTAALRTGSGATQDVCSYNTTRFDYRTC